MGIARRTAEEYNRNKKENPAFKKTKKEVDMGKKLVLPAYYAELQNLVLECLPPYHELTKEEVDFLKSDKKNLAKKLRQILILREPKYFLPVKNFFQELVIINKKSIEKENFLNMERGLGKY